MVEAADLADIVESVFRVGRVKIIDECVEHTKTIVDVGRIVEKLMAFGGRQRGKHVGENAPALLFRARDRAGPVGDLVKEGVTLVVFDAGKEKWDSR